jgi:hypothetical protein
MASKATEICLVNRNGWDFQLLSNIIEIRPQEGGRCKMNDIGLKSLQIMTDREIRETYGDKSLEVQTWSALDLKAHVFRNRFSTFRSDDYRLMSVRITEFEEPENAVCDPIDIGEK